MADSPFCASLCQLLLPYRLLAVCGPTVQREGRTYVPIHTGVLSLHQHFCSNGRSSTPGQFIRPVPGSLIRQYFADSLVQDETTAGAIATLMFSLSLTFNGVIQTPDALPGFWIFMYRVSPLTYLVSGILSVGLHGRPAICSPNELSVFDPPSGQTCGQYLKAYLRTASGHLIDQNATARCQYCPLSTADQFLASVSSSWDTRWRNFGLIWAYIAFNIVMTFVLYYCFRVKKWSFTLKLQPGWFGAKNKGVEAGQELERHRIRRKKAEIQPRAY